MAEQILLVASLSLQSDSLLLLESMLRYKLLWFEVGSPIPCIEFRLIFIRHEKFFPKGAVRLSHQLHVITEIWENALRRFLIQRSVCYLEIASPIHILDIVRTGTQFVGRTETITRFPVFHTHLRNNCLGCLFNLIDAFDTCQAPRLLSSDCLLLAAPLGRLGPRLLLCLGYILGGDSVSALDRASLFAFLACLRRLGHKALWCLLPHSIYNILRRNGARVLPGCRKHCR